MKDILWHKFAKHFNPNDYPPVDMMTPEEEAAAA
jgi:hypothetical protein